MTAPRRPAELPAESSYTQYLPPAVWSAGKDQPLSVVRLLQIIEAILTGRRDAPDLTHRPNASGAAHVHDDLQTQVDRLVRVADPALTPERFLPWLAGRVDLELRDVWVDQRIARRAVADKAALDGRRGLRDGLDRALDLYSTSVLRPRITVDDGTSMRWSRRRTGQRSPVVPLVSQGARLSTGGATTTVAQRGLIYPYRVAATPDGDLLVADDGIATIASSAVWRMSRTGVYRDAGGSPPGPSPVGPAGTAAPQFGGIRGLVVDDRVIPWQAYVVDQGITDAALYRVTATALGQIDRLGTAAQLQIAHANGLILGAPGHVLVLCADDDVASPKIVDLDLSGATPTPTPHPLGAPARFARSMAEVGGSLLLGDCRAKTDTAPGNLLLVDRSASAWSVTPLLPTDPTANPLISPVALEPDGPDAVLVLDTGLRPIDITKDKAVHAEPPTVYRVGLQRSATSPTVAAGPIEPVTEPGGLVDPRDLLQVDGVLYVCDPGESIKVGTHRLRTSPDEVGVFVRFSDRRPATDRDITRIKSDVGDLVRQMLPASALGWLNGVPIDPARGM